MKLINFDDFLAFQKIRKQMGIDDNYKPSFEGFLTTIDIIELRTTGVDVLIDDISKATNKTLEHKDFPGQKMLVYIRDFIGDYVKDERDRSSLPKFHIAWCQTLDKMHKDKKYERYVVSQRNDGIFLLNKTTNGKVVKKNIELELLVCKNCLKTLNYKGYAYNKEKVFDNFKVKDFLDDYNTEIHLKPIHTNTSQPLNEYDKEWNRISTDYKISKKYKCQGCGKDCSKDTNELHVHHVDGVKSNNKPSNLEVVCVSCHSEKPMHGHMRSNPKFLKYINR